jgi:small-conductance mechanosensitive channel
MSRLVSRILLSIFMFPLATVFYIFVMVVTGQTVQGSNYRPQEAVMFLVSSVMTWIVVAGYWCLLWRSGVNWNSSRVVRTFLAALGAAAVGGLAGVFAGLLVNHDDGSFGIFIGGILTIILWLIATVFIWRETTAERADRIKGASKSAITCPTYGYNLTGLSESRCPECGSKFTLDELMASQLNTEKEIE